MTLDTTIPDAPTGLAATARESGEVKLSWNANTDINIVGYEIYRSDQPITDIATATQANSSAVTSNGFTDLPPAQEDKA